MASAEKGNPTLRRQPRYALLLDGRPALEYGVWRKKESAALNVPRLREKFPKAAITVRRVWVAF